MELDPDMTCSASVSQATPLCECIVAHVALAPQVEFQLLEGMQQENTSWTRRQSVLCSKRLCNLNNGSGSIRLLSVCTVLRLVPSL